MYLILGLNKKEGAIMKRRVLSLVLALMMCFTALSTAVVAEDSELMGSPMGDTIRLYIDRVWDWQENQFDAMTAEQTAVVDEAYANYDADAFTAIVADTAKDVLAENTAFFERETIKDLYMWKTMRDMMEGRIEVALDDAGFAQWMADFTAFEQANDEAISPSKPNAALSGLGSYAEDLTNFWGDLAGMYANGAQVTGADAEKFTTYANMFLEESGEPGFVGDEAAYMAALNADVVELLTEGTVNGFELVLKVACGEKVRGDAIFEEIPDRDFKASFLLFGEDYVRFTIDSIPTLRRELVKMDKRGILSQIVSANAAEVLDGNNEKSYNAMYDVMRAVSEYILNRDFMAEYVEKAAEIGFADIAGTRDTMIQGVKEAMATIDPNHGLELVHFNTYMGRTVLTPVMDSVIEIEAGTTETIKLGFDHTRYAFVEEVMSNLPSVAQFDFVIEGEGAITAELSDAIGEIVVDATNAANGDEIILNIYRGYHDDLNASAADAYRYVTTYTVKAVSDVEPPYVTLEDIADFKLSEQNTVTVKGTTNLDNVTVAITKGNDNVFVLVYTKAEYEAGITLNVPDGAVVGDVYTVTVGSGATSATDTFEILAEDAEPKYVTLEDIADFKLSEQNTVTIKGTTNLDDVTVAITRGNENVFVLVYTKAEYEAGITLNVPDGVQVGYVYTVTVGSGATSATDTFEILAEDAEPKYVTLEDIADFKLSEQNTVTVKGTTNLDNVTVSITKGNDNVYVLVYTKAEYEAGITLNVPDGAVVGDVYTVTVGSGATSATDTFEILAEDAVEPTLALAGKTERRVRKGGTIEITTTPQNVPAGADVKVVWTIEDEEKAEVVSLIDGIEGLDYDNIAKIKGLKRGTTTVTATLMVDGVAVDSKVIELTVYVSSPPVDRDEPTEKETETEKVDVHTCQWPDISATTTKEAHWAHLTIDQMTINGYIAGYPDGTFKPDELITRAEFSAIVYRILGLENAEDGVIYDDTKGHWAEDIIATMSLPEGYGMLRGYGDGNFGPNDHITREQAVAIIARAKSATWKAAEEGAKDVFADAEDISWWFDGEMDAAVTNGLITGYADGSYKPLNNTTRAEACVLLARAWPEVLE